MATDREHAHQRASSLFSNPAYTQPTYGGREDLARAGTRGLRPLPASRDGSPYSHGRVPSIDYQPSKSEQSFQSGSADSSPGMFPQSSVLRSSASTQQLPSMSSPSFSTAFTSIRSNNGHSPLTAASLASQSLHTSNNPQTFGAAPSPAHPSRLVQELAADGPLMAPPRIGEASLSRPSSPASSAVESLGRGQQGSLRGSVPGSRATSPSLGNDSSRPSTPTEGKLVKKKGWVSNKFHNRSGNAPSVAQESQAWIVTPQDRTPYELSRLISGQPVTELWDSGGNTFVHLFARKSGRGPSFKISSMVLSSSRVLSSLIHGGSFPGRGREISNQNHEYPGQNLHKHMRHVSLDVPPTTLTSKAPPLSHHRSSSTSASLSSRPESAGMGHDNFRDSADDIHLYIPMSHGTETWGSEISTDDIDKLVAIRNLFAFLMGQVLVGTAKRPSLFSIFLQVAELLRDYDFTNFDGSTFGEAPEANFVCYVTDLRLGDVRSSREKTIEAIVLGEQMKSWNLFNEGFVHGVGKWDDLVLLAHPSFSMINDTTQRRMEKASRDLCTRLKGVQAKLDDFDFPSLFAGIAASSTLGKTIDFKAWKASFASMRKHTLALYKARYGSWPPKAKSKKNEFEGSGLNRLLLREVYQDFSDIYDMLVDRTALTTRTTDMLSFNEVLSTDPQLNALLKILSEFDRSSPPVLPPIPFDLPLLPDLSTTRREFEGLTIKKQTKERSKKLKDDEINMALMQSYNRESIKVTPFVEAFMTFERTMAHGKSMQEILDLRVGQWIFLYVILQSLPLLVVDAPGLEWTEGVEYFLCEVPKGTPPWVREDARHKVGYYRVPDGTIVSLPPDVVDYGVEGIYRRSHCWQAADQWTSQDAVALGSASIFSPYSPFQVQKPFPQGILDGADLDLRRPPSSYLSSGPGSRASSPDRQSPRSSVAYGLDLLPLPHDVVLGGLHNGSRVSSAPDPTKSFDNILGTAGSSPRKKK
ncbi:hypothetical protein MMC11_007769 [Xylographa trunciseda]|nr:hypothetical protein [Xylographa trunciseda]